MRKPLFQFVKKTGANIGCKLSVLKSLALGNRYGNTSPCFAHGNCKCCLMIDEPNIEEVNGVPVVPAPGNCKSMNIIYLVTCRLCKKSCIGRTVQPLTDRMSGHRACYYQSVEKTQWCGHKLWRLLVGFAHDTWSWLCWPSGLQSPIHGTNFGKL